MDFVKIGLSNLVESLFNIIATIYNFVIQLVMSSYNQSDQFLQLQVLDNLRNSITDFSYTLLITVALVSIIKMYIVEESDIQISELLFRLTMTATAIAVTPEVVDLIVSETYKIMTNISGIKTSITPVDFSSLDIIELIEAMDKIALSATLVLLVILLVCFIIVFILVIHIAMMSVFLIFLKIFSSLAALSFMSNYPSLYITLIKDVIGIMLTRIIQITCLMLSLDMVNSAISSFVTTFGMPTFTTINLCVTSLALMLAILFVPEMFKKYTGSESGKTMAPNISAIGTALAYRKF